MNSEKAASVFTKTTLSANPPPRNDNINTKYSRAMVICINLGISGMSDIFC